MRHSIHTSVLLIALMLLSACGGGGDSTTAEGDIPDGGHIPVADAGPDQNIPTSSLIQLNGSGSSDADGDALTYGWSIISKPANSTATLSALSVVNPTFTAELEGLYVIELTVNDGTLNSAADSVIITASSTNSAPVANAGRDQHINTSSTATLDGSGSSDANDDNLTYSWSFALKPESSNTILSDATLVNPTFLADLDGSYVVQLIVNDGTVNSTADTVTITGATANAAPVANAGEDQNVDTTSAVTLDGASSSDADLDTLTYIWSITSKPDGSSAVLLDATVVNPTFTADVDGMYVMQLIVNDGTVDSAADTVTVTATSPVSLTFVSFLHNDVRETSGLANVEGKIYTHNDSGGSALLYEINATTGDVVRSVIVNGATNVDWEDLACDDAYLYIADTGNDLGSRSDLKIYKILKSDLAINDTVNAETIAFSYADQTTFSYEPYTTPYDAEALIAHNGQLYIFTKNWEDYTSRIYSVSTDPGSYVVTSVDEKTLDVMVTGAAIDGAGSSIALVGYTNPYDTNIPFKSMIVKLSGFTGNDFFSGNIAGYEIGNSYIGGQIEAVLFNTSSVLYLSAEGVTILSVEYRARFYETEIR